MPPLVLATALPIKVTSPGPVFFTKERLGRNKRLFRVCKFTTELKGADRMLNEFHHLSEADGAVFKIRNDLRIPPFGKFLRKPNIDAARVRASSGRCVGARRARARAGLPACTIVSMNKVVFVTSARIVYEQTFSGEYK